MVSPRTAGAIGSTALKVGHSLVRQRALVQSKAVSRAIV
jgi:hypothetical protein